MQMTQHDNHGPEGLAADLPHLTRRRLLVTGLAMNHGQRGSYLP